MSPLALPLGAFLLMGHPAPIDIEALRVVSYYHSNFYIEGDPPFTASPRQVVPHEAITSERIRAVLTGRNLVIEVCPFVRFSAHAAWRVPSSLSERQRSCEAYGAENLQERLP